MKNLNLILSAVVIAALVTSCSRSPKSCFKVEVHAPDGSWVPTNTGKVGDRFYFSTVCSENAGAGTKFDYGDGTTGNNEGHEYTKPGSYTVKVTVYGKKGELSDISSQSVSVKELQADATPVKAV